MPYGQVVCVLTIDVLKVQIVFALPTIQKSIQRTSSERLKSPFRISRFSHFNIPGYTLSLLGTLSVTLDRFALFPSCFLHKYATYTIFYCLRSRNLNLCFTESRNTDVPKLSSLIIARSAQLHLFFLSLHRLFIRILPCACPEIVQLSISIFRLASNTSLLVEIARGQRRHDSAAAAAAQADAGRVEAHRVRAGLLLRVAVAL